MNGAELKRLTGRMLFASELLLFGWIYMYGAQGFIELTALRDECKQIEAHKNERVASIKKLQDQIIAWNVHSFAKEKLAREQLQMARKDDIIYLT